VDIAVKIRSNYMDLKTLLFEEEEQVELPRNAVLSYVDTDADLSGFETEVILDLETEINSTEAVEPVAEYLYKKMKDLDRVEITVKDRDVDLSEQDIRRGLMKAYYKN
jgi:hypothetical protein